jgi:hypothetical protein
MLFVNGMIIRPQPADLANITDGEAATILNWDIAQSRARGYLGAKMDPEIWQRVLTETGVVPPAEPTGLQVWDAAEDLYSALPLSKIYDLYRKTLQFKLAAHLLPTPQITKLEDLYCQLANHAVIVPHYL